MTAPPDMRRHAQGDIVDAVVIGSGAGGAPLAWRLARAGCSVVMLEAGRWWTPAEDFATDEAEQDKLFWTDERLSAGGDPVAFGANNSGIGVGGSTLHWTAYCPRAQPDDLRLRSEFGVGRDWPLSYADLAPYYDAAERFIGVSGPSPYPWGPARNGGYPLPPLPLNTPAQIMAQGCEALGIATSPAPNAALSRTYWSEGVGFRSACSNRGFCQGRLQPTARRPRRRTPGSPPLCTPAWRCATAATSPASTATARGGSRASPTAPQTGAKPARRLRTSSSARGAWRARGCS